MIINIDLLDGATLEYDGIFYTVLIEDNRANITELFTSLRVMNSSLESEIMRSIIKGIKEQTD